ncbi:hypothetical protein [Candidatus Nanohalobium constans]|uniref:PKD domain-containing protein n=1 Tax=Candidatus Nanohalobium constans TaxID=2565781 RepID=A0A5Q0UF43_9ARCH|nr:hypothetical protein [Candidatus Nanohalobium constans]QGA80212.1 hypothetical protein LC1Nh_0309 [Candidatus Nanohalobium constans]
MKIAVASTLVLAALASFSIIGPDIKPGYEEIVTGSFTEASKDTPRKQEPYIEEVHWKFDDGRNATGRLTRQNLSPGKHNITVIVEKSNGATDKYHQQLRVEK